MHRVLRRQIERVMGRDATLTAEMTSLLALVDDSYRQAEEDRRLIASAQQLASNELLAANERLRAILAAFPDTYLHLDADGNVTECQGGNGGLAGTAAWALAGKRLENTVLAPVAPRLQAGVAEACRADAGVILVENVAVGERWYEARIAGCDGGGCVIVLRDVTERRQALLVERHMQLLMTATLDALPLSIAILDGAAQVIATNRAWDLGAWAIGMSPAMQRQSWNYLDVCARSAAAGCADAEHVGDGLRRVIEGETESFHYQYQCEGYDRWFLLHVTSMAGECDGRVVVAHEDITERQHWERALLESERCMRAILASSADGIIGYGVDQRVAFVNPAGQRLLGQDSAQLLGCHLDDLFGAQVTARLQSGALLTETIIEHPDSGPATFEMARSDIPEGGGVLSLRDVTQRRQLQGQLAQAQKFEAIGQLAAGVAHEINTPTQYIGDNVRFLRDAFADMCRLLDGVDQLLADCELPELQALRDLQRQIDVGFLRAECPQAIAQSLDGVERVSHIVYSMKDFSHPDRGEKSMVDLNRVAESAITVCRNEWKYVAEMTLDLDPALPSVVGYRSDLGQVVLNLVVNAAHAIADVVGDGAGGKGHITVRTLRCDGGVELQVADTGSGIPEEHRQRIFEQFFTTKPVGKGTGQGLALVHRIVVDRHGGRVSFDTRTGRGTTFSVRLPIN